MNPLVARRDGVALDEVLAVNVGSGIRLDANDHLIVPPLDADGGICLDMVGMCGHRARLIALGALSMVLAVGGCGGTDADRPSSEGPFIGSDPDGLIMSVSWVDPLEEIPPIRLSDPDEWPGAVLLDTSRPGLLMVAVAGTLFHSL